MSATVNPVDPTTTCAFSRRAFLGGSLGIGAGLALDGLRARLAFASQVRDDVDTLVVVWLRGGMDSLSAIVPVGEARYHDLRPDIAVRDDQALDLDGTFGLHPRLAPLHDLFTGGVLAAVTAVGNPVPTRSHFSAMDELERGTPGSTAERTGWLTRYLDAASDSAVATFQAVGIGTRLPTSLLGATSAVALDTVAGFHVDASPAELALVEQALADLHAASAEQDALAAEAVRALRAVGELRDAAPPGGAVDPQGYPLTQLGQGLAQVAALIHADVGLEVAAVDGGGWDTHVAMGDADAGTMAAQLDDLARSIAAFAGDLVDHLDRVTLVTLTEFGRRVGQNASGGTDHGRASASLVLTGSLTDGGPARGAWPTLDDDALERPGGEGDARGDLAVTTDLRDLLADVVGARLAPADLGAVFPGHDVTATGLLVPRG